MLGQEVLCYSKNEQWDQMFTIKNYIQQWRIDDSITLEKVGEIGQTKISNYSHGEVG